MLKPVNLADLLSTVTGRTTQYCNLTRFVTAAVCREVPPIHLRFFFPSLFSMTCAVKMTMKKIFGSLCSMSSSSNCRPGPASLAKSRFWVAWWSSKSDQLWCAGPHSNFQAARSEDLWSSWTFSYYSAGHPHQFAKSAWRTLCSSNHFPQ